MTTLRLPRIVFYILTNWLAIVAGGAALNALVKARHDRDRNIKLAVQLSPLPNFSVDIDLNDILTSGGFLAAGELLLSLIAFFSAVCLIFPPLIRHTEKKSVQGFAVGCWIFGLLWTFASAVATTDYAVNRDAKVKAYSNGVQLDPQIVSALQKATGLSPKYWIHGYTKFLAIAPWPLMPFAIISLALTIVAWQRAPSYPSGAPYSENAAVITQPRDDSSHPASAAVEETKEEREEREVMKEV